MPIEIKELVVRVAVNEPHGEAGRPGEQGISKEVIQRIVDQVVEALKQQKER